MFALYPSAVPAGSGHNYILTGKQHLTVRTYLAAYPGLSDKWRFYHQNGVDSTFADGGIAYRNRSGGKWTIVRARVGVGQKSSGVEMDTPDPVTGWVDVTYDGKTCRAVAPGECFWSDEVTLSLPAGHDLVWEWELDGEDIPSTPDSQAATFTDTGDGFSFREEAPLPDLFGNARTVMGRIAFLGDSITQGCQTRKNRYEMWAGRIARSLAPDYAAWNLGLGYGRGADMATDGFWMRKAKTADIACVAYGVNDLLSGPYKLGRGANADEVLATIGTVVRKLKDSGVRVIVFSVPPFHYEPTVRATWEKIDRALPALCETWDVDFFDFAAVLDARHPYGDVCNYGPHPNGEGGRLVCEAFLVSGLIR